jgi:hypothetical protein
MSESSPPPNNAVPDNETRIVAQLLIYTTTRDAKNKIKETKVPKVKELDFSVSCEGYVNFLDTMLSKHAQEVQSHRAKAIPIQVSTLESMHSPIFLCITYLHGFSLANPINVETKSDWYNMYNDIANNLSRAHAVSM